MKRVLLTLIVLPMLLTSCKKPDAFPSPRPTDIAVSPAGVPTELLNPKVTQATITTTVCVVGWTTTIRPPVSYTNALKKQQLFGKSDQNMSDYEEDHWIPLELGGNPTDTHNLWPELWPDAHKKDAQENADHKAVCANTMTLLAAQLDMYKNWRK